MRLPRELILRNALEDAANGGNLFAELGENGGNGIRHNLFLLERLTAGFDSLHGRPDAKRNRAAAYNIRTPSFVYIPK